MGVLFGSLRSGLKVEKWHGARNDFIFAEANAFWASLVDVKDEGAIARIAVELCDRSGGLGADGLVLWLKESSGALSAAIWNSDGSRAGTCGNALRCLAGLSLANKLWSGIGEFPVHELSFTHEGPVQGSKVFAKLLECSNVDSREQVFLSKVEMGGVVKNRPVPRSGLSSAAFIGGTVAQEILLSVLQDATFVELANPHLVLTLKPDSFRRFSSEHFVELGTLLQSQGLCQSLGMPVSNIGFVELPNEKQIQSGQALNAIVFERGAGLTQCCGSGGCAMKVALENSRSSQAGTPESFSMPGGIITISGDHHALQLAGPAQRVCRLTLE